MPRVHKHKARKDIYKFGKYLDNSKTKSGKRLDRSIPRDENDYVIVPKGKEYYSWKFRHGGKHISLTYPKQSQLTQSDFLQRVYQVDESQPISGSKEDLESWLEEVIYDMEELRDEQEEKRENMPENLAYSPVAELLQERYDDLDSWINELEQFKDEVSDCEDEFEDLINNLPTYEGN